MAKVAVIIDDMFEDVEYTKPVEAYKEAGHEIVHVGVKEGKKVYGKRDKTEVVIDEDVKNVSPDDFDALLVPGGYSPDHLRANDEAVEFTKKFAETSKPIFMICHAAQLLVTADVLKGRILTGYKAIIQDIKNAGAEYQDKEVVIDDNFVSSRHPGDLPVFIEESLKKLK
ncbi:MAG: type 1 glutamine amidotransferase domain-containing protein [Thermotogota bacterium]